MITCHHCKTTFPGEKQQAARMEAKVFGWQFYASTVSNGKKVDICPVCAKARREQKKLRLGAYARNRRQVAGRFV